DGAVSRPRLGGLEHGERDIEQCRLLEARAHARATTLAGGAADEKTRATAVRYNVGGRKPMTTTPVPALKLNSGGTIPQIGLGVWQSPKGATTQHAVRAALRLGYGHIDTARIYGNEHDVGEGVRASGVPRPDVFVTTKLWNDDQGY